jgi:tripartite-type tricarboxylate transporter receptor subunit TctC
MSGSTKRIFCPSRHVSCAVASMLILLSTASAPVVAATSYPSRPIRFIVPFPPGGSTDHVARVVAQQLGTQVNQQIVVDNRGGASGIIGSEMGARSAPDAYTLLLAGITTHATIPHLNKKLPYHPLKDFSPITLLATASNVLVMHPSLPFKTVADLLAHAKKNPRKLNYASAGTGSPAHISIELLCAMAGISMTHVPYKGAGPALIDLVGGQVQLMSTSPLATIAHVNAGRLRILAVTSKKRIELLPAVPTVAESGLPGYVMDQWWGMVAPAATPADRIVYLNRELLKVLKLQDIRQRLAASGADAAPSSPQEFAAYMKSELEKFGKLIRESGISSD